MYVNERLKPFIRVLGVWVRISVTVYFGGVRTYVRGCQRRDPRNVWD